ncbi:MAG TPA: hypothetical protein VLS89_02805 [Candidatus Nanopelagicales bacterium]|nr:hypothetical protein [Candidatus Nanopelagicales bacterium]
MRALTLKIGAVLVLVAGLASAAGCQFVTAVDRDDIPGGEGGAGTGGAGNQGGGGGGGQGGGGGGTDSCTDALQNGAETDVDCGGGSCPPCDAGQRCDGDADCASGTCTGGTCVDTLLISEIRTRGLAGAGDEFIELYNPGNAPVTVTGDWTLEVRGVAQGNCKNTLYIARWNGNGETISAHGHLLIAANGYTQDPAADVVITGGGFLPDAGSVRLLRNADVADAICFHFNQQTQDTLADCPDQPFTCEGTPVQNPHNGSDATNTDESLERGPGGAAGNATDTDDNSADFAVITPAAPQSTASPATP